MNHDEKEWLAQEAAFDNERCGLAHGDDPLVAGYRRIARVLAEPPVPTLPADFARSVARRIHEHAELDARFEQRLVLALFAAMAIAAVIVAAIYGDTWVQAGVSILPNRGSGSIQWLLLLSACIGMSWITTALRRRPAP